MCEPATVALTLTAVSAAVAGYGQLQAGKAAEGQANYQASVDRNNSIIADRNSADALKRGEEAERRERLRTAQTIGAQRAGFAANNIDLGSDNVVDTLADTAMIGELDALTVRSNYAREAYGYKVQGMNFDASAANNTLSGKNAKSASLIGAGSSILSGASTVADRWTIYKQKGALA